MAKARPSITKRLREKTLMEKRQRKQERKADRVTDRDDVVVNVDGDPDLAGIVPGPQKPAWIDFVPEDERPGYDD
ncbi:MAG: hypothetical protein KC613_24600 [Myxococcales bacterium]|nr:hypothetical protein [Myxococcales bacterium]MCB9525173.1 hypothetical protein [Myxococcales bacterium]